MYWAIADILQKYSRQIRPLGIQLIAELESLRSILGESFFNIMKLWEPLITGSVVADKDNDLGFSGLLTSTIESLNKERPGFSESNLFKLMLPKTNSNEDIMIAYEMSGLCKLFGHPCINAFDGVKTIRQHACEYVPINSDLAQDLRNHWVSSWIKQYFERNGKWPEVDKSHIYI